MKCDICGNRKKVKINSSGTKICQKCNREFKKVNPIFSKSVMKRIKTQKGG